MSNQEKPKRGRPAKPKTPKEPKPKGGARPNAGRKPNPNKEKMIGLGFDVSESEYQLATLIAEGEGMTYRQIFNAGVQSIALKGI